GELAVDLEADHGLRRARGGRGHADDPPGAACSIARATRNITTSPCAGASTCTPIGSAGVPEGASSGTAAPYGTDIAACPARFVGIVHTSLRYIVSGSAVLVPSSNAT